MSHIPHDSGNKHIYKHISLWIWLFLILKEKPFGENVGLQYLICGYRWFMQGCILPALLSLEREDETQKCPWGDVTQQNGSTLTKYFVIGQPSWPTDSHRGESGKNITLGPEVDISPAGTLTKQNTGDHFGRGSS